MRPGLGGFLARPTRTQVLFKIKISEGACVEKAASRRGRGQVDQDIMRSQKPFHPDREDVGKDEN